MAERVEGLVAGQRQLLAAVSHEVRTPLARLRFLLETLHDTPSETMTNIDAELDAIDGLLGELLEVARLDEPPLDSPEPGCTAEVVEDVCTRLRSLGEAKLEWSVQGEVRMSRRDLTRVVGNLVSNALRHATSRVRVLVTDDLLVVEDDGPGIPEPLRARVFEPFVTGDESRNRSLGGVGLGLTLVSRAARRWGAAAWVGDSGLGGARFEVRWPRP